MCIRDSLKRHCDAVGRDYATIERTLLAPYSVGPDERGISSVAANCRDWAALGFQHVIFTSVPNVHTLAPLDTIGREVIPAVADL